MIKRDGLRSILGIKNHRFVQYFTGIRKPNPKQFNSSVNTAIRISFCSGFKSYGAKSEKTVFQFTLSFINVPVPSDSILLNRGTIQIKGSDVLWIYEAFCIKLFLTHVCSIPINEGSRYVF